MWTGNTGQSRWVVAIEKASEQRRHQLQKVFIKTGANGACEVVQKVIVRMLKLHLENCSVRIYACQLKQELQAERVGWVHLPISAL